MKNVTIYAWGAANGLDSASPYCLKTLYALRYKKIPHTTKVVGAKFPSWAKRGTLPIAQIDERTVEDSSHILRALDALNPSTPPLYPEDKAIRGDTVMLESWADEWLVLYALHYRWAVDTNFKPFFTELMKGIPSVVRTLVAPSVRGGVVKMLKARGFGHDTEEQRRAHFAESLSALEARLASRPFLTCDHPTAADFSVYGVLSIIEAARFPETANVFDSYPDLKAWLSRMREASRA